MAPHQQVFAKSQNGGGGERKADVDIFSMLSKAQRDFNNSGPSEQPSGPQLNKQFAGMQMNNPPPPQMQMQHHHQPVMRQLSNAMPDITSPNVVNFFAAAQQPNGGISEGQLMQQKQFNHPNVPPVQTLDEIEKQHRVSASPPQQQQLPKMGELTD